MSKEEGQRQSNNKWVGENIQPSLGDLWEVGNVADRNIPWSFLFTITQMLVVFTNKTMNRCFLLPISLYLSFFIF